MHKLIVQLLFKYEILKVIPAQESFFEISLLNKKVKLSPELIQLNYAKLSPISNPEIISYKEKNTIYLWFLKKQKRDEKILIPESFLIYKALSNKQDGIFIFKTEPKQVYIIKNKILQTTFISYEDIDSPSIDIAKDEYDLEFLEIIDAKIYDKMLQNEIDNLTIKDLFAFIQISLDKENIKNFFIQRLTYPIVSLFFIYMLVSYAQGYFLEKKVDNLTQKYQTLKTKNSNAKNLIRKHNIEVIKLEQFFKTEFEPVEPFKIVYDLYKIIPPIDKATVTFLSITNNNIKIRIKTKDDAIKYLKHFNAISYLTDIVIDNTFKRRDGYKVHTFTMKIKADNE